jgi:tetratricopeptide (TPR) repeat protein
MKSVITILAALAIVVSALPATAGSDVSAVHWSDASWSDILATAKKENKHVFIDFFATWCSPCKAMDKTTFMDPKVGEFLNANIPVSYDAEKGVGEELAAKYRIAHYPTFVMIGPDGQEIDRFVGYLEPEAFLDTMVGYTKGVGTIDWYAEKSKADPDNIELHNTLVAKYADAVIPEKAEKHFNKLVALDPGDENGYRAEALYNLGEGFRCAKQATPARTYFEKLLADYPETDYYDKVLTLLARVDYTDGKPEQAVARYEEYLSRDPENPSRMNALAWFCSQRAIGLDRALPVALKAAELSNRNPGILDTLAEVYYAMGDYDNALKIGKEALDSDPDDTYFNNQVKKYQHAKQEADSQASR